MMSFELPDPLDDEFELGPLDFDLPDVALLEDRGRGRGASGSGGGGTIRSRGLNPMISSLEFSAGAAT